MAKYNSTVDVPDVPNIDLLTCGHLAYGSGIKTSEAGSGVTCWTCEEINALKKEIKTWEEGVTDTPLKREIIGILLRNGIDENNSAHMKIYNLISKRERLFEEESAHLVTARKTIGKLFVGLDDLQKTFEYYVEHDKLVVKKIQELKRGD